MFLARLHEVHIDFKDRGSSGSYETALDSLCAVTV